MNVFELTRNHLIDGLDSAKEHGIDGNAYGQALMWNLLTYYKSTGRSEQDIKDEVLYSLDNIDDDGTFHVSRN